MEEEGAQPDLRVYKTWGLQAKECEPSYSPELEGTWTFRVGGGQKGLAFHQPLLTYCWYSPGFRSFEGGLKSVDSMFNVTGRGW